MFSVIFSEEAMEDLDIAVDYYSNISAELGNRFFKNFDKCSLELESMPFFQIRYDEIRLRKISKFPVLLHFTINENKTIVVHAIRFAKQNPDNFPKI